MLYLRTAAGSFISSTVIVGLAPQRGDDGEIVGWIAAHADGTTTPLASFFGTKGRIEKVLPHLFCPIAAPVLVPRTAKPADIVCSSPDCCAQIAGTTLAPTTP
jgi:hypothetical protein